MVSNSDSSKNSSGRRFHNSARELVKQWRYRGHTGRLIRRHRALRSLDIQTSSILDPLLLTVGTIVLIIWQRNSITKAWTVVLQFWCDSIGLDTNIETELITVVGEISYQIPVLQLLSPQPSVAMLRTTLIVVVLAMLGAYLFLRRFLPLCYLVWAIGLIQLVAIAYFYYLPNHFPYDIGSHVSSSLELTLMLMLLLPILLMVAYYPLNFSWIKKVVLTSLMVGMVFLFVPHLYACHIVIMSFFSVLFMPILFTAFGTFPVILMVIAIYGWGMSWSQRY